LRPNSSARVVRIATPISALMFLAAAMFLAGCAAVSGSKSSDGPSPTSAISVAVSPATVSLQAGKTTTFRATVANDSGNKGVTWALSSGSGTCSSATCGTISSTASASGAAVTYTAPASITNAATIKLTATSVADATKSASATATVSPTPLPIGVAVSPASASVQAAQSLAFTATVTNDTSNQGVTWTLSSGAAACTAATCGTLSAASTASGATLTYTAPASVATSAIVTVTAKAIADTTKTAAATITVTAAPAPIAISITPPTASVQANSGTKSFTATVQNDSANKGVTWSLSGAGCATSSFCGTLSATSTASGAALVYTAPASVPVPAAVTLTATSVSDTSKSAAATITVTAPAGSISVMISPTSASVVPNGTQQFTATVLNDALNKGVTWTLIGSSCSEGQCGTIAPTSSASGAAATFTAPSSIPTPASLTLRATSIANSAKIASVTVTIVANNVAVAITPKRGGITIGQTLNVSATLTNDVTNQGVVWSASETGCSGDGCGTFSNDAAPSSSATYTAPATPGVYTITATAVANSTQTASATIGVTDLTGLVMYHNDLSRTGVNGQEYALTNANVSSHFGKLTSCAVDGAIYAQPLWIPHVTINGAAHNIVLVATAHDSLYAFDADVSPCIQLWHANMIDAAHGGTSGEMPVQSGIGGSVGIGQGDITPETGILSTPAIDLSSSTLYALSQSANSSASSFFQRLHAIDFTTGNEKQTPMSITSAITVPGNGDGGTTVSFNTRSQNQRASLALVNGLIYVCWGSHEDGPTYRGWVMSFDKNTLNLVHAFNTTPNSSQGGVWMAGAAPAFDASNNLYVLTGNGAFDGFTSFGDSLLKLTSALSLSDWFTPSDQANLDANDLDLGSGGAAILVDLPSSSPHQHLIVGGGKGSGFTGELYVLDRDSLGGYLQGSGSTDAVVQEFSFGHAIFATGTFWQNSFYVAGVRGPLESFALNPSSSTFSTTPSSQSADSFGFPGATAALSASGTSNGIVWALDNSKYCTPRSSACGPAVLHAYDATNLGTELWNSSSGSGNTAGNAVKFTVPTVANGKVYVGTRGSDTGAGGSGELDIYGLLQN
jgi:hypothetical protein